MNLGIYGILAIIIFVLFIVLMILNPNLSCFGRRISSPLYPLLRKRKRKLKTQDYGFKLVDHPVSRTLKKNESGRRISDKNVTKTKDYGFRLD